MFNVYISCPIQTALDHSWGERKNEEIIRYHHMYCLIWV